MANSYDVYSEYRLMNETFTLADGTDICKYLAKKSGDNVFKAKDSRGKEVMFLKLSSVAEHGHLYVNLLPITPVQGHMEGDTVVFEADEVSDPPSMHAVRDKVLEAELKDDFLSKFEKQINRADDMKSRLEDPNDHGSIELCLDDDRNVHFRKLASMYIGDDFYVLFEPLDCFDTFTKNGHIVYRYNENSYPQSFEVPDYKYQAIIRGKYYGEQRLRWKRDGNRRLASGELVYDDFFEKSTFTVADGKNIYDLLLASSVEKSGPIVLVDDAEREMSFSIEAVTSYDYRLYALLNPVTEIKGCDGDTEILFCVNDAEGFAPVLTVETRSDVYDKIVDGIYEIFDRDGKGYLDYPRAEEIVDLGLYDSPVFLKKKGGSFCRFLLEYVVKDRPGKTYAVLRALSTGRGFVEDTDYVFGVGRGRRAVLEEEDDDIARGVMEEYEEKKKSEDAGKGDVAAMAFRCRNCYNVYSGNVCPKCGTVRKNLDSADFPACTYLNCYSESLCRGYIEWEKEKYGYMSHENFARCGVAPVGDVPCVMDFKPSGEGFVVTGIGGCRAESIEIPSEYDARPVVGIEKSAFSKCAVHSFHIPATVKSVGVSAFEGSPDLGKVVFDSLTRIEENTFANCPSYFGPGLPDNLESIGRHAFLNCKNIRDVYLPASVTVIERGAYEGCTGIEAVYYMGTEEEWNKIRIEKEGNEEFLDAEIVFYSEEKPTGPGKFWHYQGGYSSRTRWKAYRESATDYLAYVSNSYLPTYGLEYREIRGGYAVVGKGVCEEKNIVVPPTHMGKKVVAVDDGAFLNDEDLRNVVISKGVDKIGERAFDGCYRLRSVTILSDLSVINEWTFNRCTSLAYIVIPETCKKIMRHAFNGCDNVSIFFKGGAAGWRRLDTALEGNACLFDDGCLFSYSEERPSPVKGHWHYTEKFKPTKWTGAQKGPAVSGNASDGGTERGVIKYPFDPAVSLPKEEVIFGNAEEENLPHGLEYQRLGKCCAVAGFGSCTDMGNLVLPSMYNGLTVTKIGPAAFKNRTDITSITVPNAVTAIDDEAFRGCTSLSETHIPDTVERIGSFAFSSCALESFNMPENTWYYFGVSAFENCKKLRSVIFSERMFDIPNSVFHGCTALEYVVFPRYFRKIGPYAFGACKSLRAVFYLSTEKEWKEEFGYAQFEKKGNEDFWNATMYFYSEERPKKPGNFWHYDGERKPAIWDLDKTEEEY